MSQPALLLLVYDAESAPCRGLVDWVRQRDRHGLVVAFPFQNPELVHLAPELAGLPMLGAVLGLDARSREVSQGPGLMPGIFRRLPGWGWMAPVMAVPVVCRIGYFWIFRSR